MAGFDRIYCLGHEGGFMGADGLNTIDLQILHGISSREWYEARPSKDFALTARPVFKELPIYMAELVPVNR